MGDDVVIRAIGLGKKYVIGHQSQEKYAALRDVITRSAKSFVRSTRDVIRGRALIPGDELEDFWALKDVSFEIKRGDVTGIIGHNGAGKSTLLKILSRITEPSLGRVEIRGRIASLLEVGTGFHPELTGRENVYLNGAILGMTRSEIKRKFDEIVDFAGIEKFIDTPVKRYSSGMYVRLAFAVAAHLEPEILVVDEVLAVGDVAFQKKCLGKMQDVAGHGRTVIFVSHNMAAVRDLCQRGLLLSGGRLIYSGKVQEAVSSYFSIADETYDVRYEPTTAGTCITSITLDKSDLRERSLNIDIGFQSEQPLHRPIGGAVLRSTTGEIVWGSNGRIHPHSNEVFGIRQGSLRCEAKHLPLFPGQYLLSVWLSDWGKDLDEKLDAILISLGDDDLDVARPPGSVVGHIDWPATWRSTATDKA